MLLFLVQLCSPAVLHQPSLPFAAWLSLVTCLMSDAERSKNVNNLLVSLALEAAREEGETAGCNSSIGCSPKRYHAKAMPCPLCFAGPLSTMHPRDVSACRASHAAAAAAGGAAAACPCKGGA